MISKLEITNVLAKGLESGNGIARLDKLDYHFYVFLSRFHHYNSILFSNWSNVLKRSKTAVTDNLQEKI